MDVPTLEGDALVAAKHRGGHLQIITSVDSGILREQLLSRPGAAELLAEIRKETLAEIGLYELRKRLEWAQDSLAARLGVSQAAVSQLERAEDGAELQLVAVFDDGHEETTVEVRIGAEAEPGANPAPV